MSNNQQFISGNKRSADFEHTTITQRPCYGQLSAATIIERKMRLNNTLSTHPYYTGIASLKEYVTKVTLSGETSSGKSSVANKIVGADILPTGKKTVTKMPQMITTDRCAGKPATYEVEWSFASPTTEKTIGLREILTNDSPKSFKEIGELFSYLESNFRAMQINYQDRVTVTKFVDEPSYFHVLDIPGTGSISSVESLIYDTHFPLNVVVLCPKNTNGVVEDAIWTHLLDNYGKKPVSMIVVINKIDMAWVAPPENESESNSNGEITAFSTFTEWASIIDTRCAEYDIPVFAVQSNDGGEITEKDNIERIKKDWSKGQHAAMCGRFQWGMQALREEILKRSTDRFTIAVYRDIVNNLRGANTLDELEIESLKIGGHEHIFNLMKRLEFGLDIIGTLESAFVKENVNFSEKLTEGLFHPSSDLPEETEAQAPAPIVAHNSVSGDQFVQVLRITHGDRRPVLDIKHMAKSDELVDKTIHGLADRAADLADIILDGFQKELFTYIEGLEHKEPKVDDIPRPITNKILQRMQNHWILFKTSQRQCLIDTVRIRLCESKHTKNRPCDRRVEQEEKVEEEKVDNSTNCDVTNGTNNGWPNIRTVFSFGTAILIPNPAQIQAPTPAQIPARTIISRSQQSMVVPFGYLSAKSKILLDVSYKQTAIDIERCMRAATQSIFNHVTELLCHVYTKAMMMDVTSYIRLMEEKNSLTVNKIKKKIEHRMETMSEINDLISTMSDRSV